MAVDLLAAQKQPRDLLATQSAQQQAPSPPPTQQPQQQSTLIDETMRGPVGQVGLGALEGLSSLPGVPMELIAAGGNYLRRQIGLPETPLENTVAKDWGVKGWNDFAKRDLGVPEGPAPRTEAERIARKAGAFAGGSLPFGPAGMLPAATATAGSEVGRATDKAGLTGGYGEIVGGIAGGAAPGLVRGGVTAGIKPAPTNQELRAASQRAYKTADDAGIIVGPQGTKNLASSVADDLADEAYHPQLHPGIGVVLQELDTLSKGNVTLKGIDVLRKLANNAAQSVNASERRLAGKVVEHIDDFVDNLSPASVVAGDAQASAAALREARDYWKRLRKSEMIDEALGKAERRAASTGSGGNGDNTVRQNIRAILDNPKKARSFTASEKALMERVVRGSPTQNLLRLVGKLSPQGNGLMAALGIGATAAMPGGWAPSVAGLVAKPIAEAMTNRNAQMLSQAVRSGPQAAPASAGTRAASLAAEAKRRAALAGQSAVRASPGVLGYREN